MCGIAGVVRRDRGAVGRELLERLLSKISMRGRDGAAGWMNHEQQVGLVHARHSVIDLPGGGQPMTAELDAKFGQLSVVFNGEIYNHRALRKELEGIGHKFTSDHSDTEVLLHGYREWGGKMMEKLEGMFAFGIWDQSNRSLFLARDRSGKKPLFYWRSDKGIVFGSTVSVVLAGMKSMSAMNVEVDGEAMLQYLRFGYTGGRSLVKGIEELEPGCWALAGNDGQLWSERYWEWPGVTGMVRVADKYDDDTAELIARSHLTLKQAVAKRLEADVSLGCFLSSGIDSSVVAALAQEAMYERGLGKLKTFCVEMPEKSYDESRASKIIAKHLGTEHVTLRTPVGDAFSDLEYLMNSCGEPTADSSILPTYWLCKAAREHVKVALSGDGGDELFCGYDRYQALRMMGKHGWWLKGMPSGMFKGTDAKNRRVRMGRLVDAAKAKGGVGQKYRRMVEIFDDELIGEVGGQKAKDALLAEDGFVMDGWAEIEAGMKLGGGNGDVMNTAMRWDFSHYLVNDILRKVDRASMGVPLEVRCPILDQDVCELAMRMKGKKLMVDGMQKGVLRRIAGMYLPKDLTQREKMGFAVPIGRWFQWELRDELRDRLLDGNLEAMGFEMEAVRRLMNEHQVGEKDHTHRLFGLLQLSIWWKWLNG
ncbi:Asparagine synthetase [glutamine-hydrolyzing] 1 [Poriferisphaera corsica]|uniref:asparagine synthase (glutamine-hydrolyzing) n=1 Tax=Poriferisphaera corsica TaxID=2528020 RepID=A0A517YTQ3_9BACT|nr:asparagine synthase (glutamine-hydrolyzing) [Poriferisphaera corsica]QDU33613.1 Asparagine synthetase [glutamine-hydrolyzing] 1 [Poriferisphaera corsica]